MARASRLAALGIVVLLLGGCGTMGNLSVGRRQGWKNALIYGGVRRDVQSAADWVDHDWTWGKNLDILQDVGTVVGVVLVGIDVPLSAIADTVTLPLTVPVAIWTRARTPAAAGRQSAPTPPPVAEPINPQ